MTKTLTLAALAALALASPVLAAETTPAATANAAAELNASADAKTAREILTGQGYTNISPLDRDERGRWIGTATKDGKTTAVAIAVPKR